MTALLTISATALLFVVFGVLRRRREPEHCGNCTSACSACKHADPVSFSEPR